MYGRGMSLGVCDVRQSLRASSVLSYVWGGRGERGALLWCMSVYGMLLCVVCGVWCVVVWCLRERGTFANVNFGGTFANVKIEVGHRTF